MAVDLTWVRKMENNRNELESSYICQGVQHQLGEVRSLGSLGGRWEAEWRGVQE